MIIFWLMAQGILHAPVLYPSLYFKREQDEYVRRLQGCREESAWQEWLEFFLDAIAEAAEEATGVALAIVDLRQEHQHLISESFGQRTFNALRLLQQLFSTPIVNAKFVEAKLAVSQPTASSLLNEFEAKGILRETTGGIRNKRYSYASTSDYSRVPTNVRDRVTAASSRVLRRRATRTSDFRVAGTALAPPAAGFFAPPSSLTAQPCPW